MAPFYVFLVFLIQGSLTLANKEDASEHEETTRDILKETPDIDAVSEIKDINKEWLDIFLLPEDNNLFPTPSAAMMSQLTKSDKPAEEQIEDIKELATQISLAIQSEMANLLRYALKDCDSELEENSLRKKRSAESPMDSSQLVMRLLRHIKSNNEYQNIAIDKMMTAQEIADKYGIEFNPDPEILSDLATAANDQAKEMTSILNDVLKIKNITQSTVEFKPVEQESVKNSTNEDAYYVYSVQVPEHEIIAQLNAVPHHEYHPEIIQYVPQDMNHYQYDLRAKQNHYYYPESQIVPPPVHQHYNPVSPMPNFYEPNTLYPSQEFYPKYCPTEPVTTTTTIVLPIEELIEPEPQLVGEEYEETVTSKVYVDHGDEPGESTVNHVMTYTISEKSHFKTPKVEKLPQQMQYYFFLM
ncbi:uncharacterized protein LOC113513608 [Galleria mellonella]|uniref:Uncharacterized protein LOC113513608 n=1 Tax=Galleria mellonella TaxID=7137 RepID=A0A6J1WH00_GALME|nr:uncharacterized protein LOC113513608 [Galleria mellonella]